MRRILAVAALLVCVHGDSYRSWGVGDWAGNMTLEEYWVGLPECDFLADGLCYTLWANPGKDVNDAELRCQADVGGHLGMVENAAQFDGIATFLDARISVGDVGVKMGAYKLTPRVVRVLSQARPDRVTTAGLPSGSGGTGRRRSTARSRRTAAPRTGAGSCGSFRVRQGRREVGVSLPRLL